MTSWGSGVEQGAVTVVGAVRHSERDSLDVFDEVLDRFGGVSRRSVVVGAVAAAAVGVTTMMLPSAVAAASGDPESAPSGGGGVAEPGELAIRAVRYSPSFLPVAFYWKQGSLPTLTEIAGEEPNHFSWSAEYYFGGESPVSTSTGFGQFTDDEAPVFTSLAGGDGERVVLTVTYVDAVQGVTFTGTVELPGGLFDASEYTTTSFTAS